MTAFNLRATVVDALDRSPAADPSVVAAEVAAAVPSNLLRSVLASVLPAYVTGVVTTTRHRALADVPDQGDQVGSRRWAAAASILMSREFVDGEWKWLRDCTADDLRSAATDRRQRAASILANADKLDALAALMDKRRASVVAELGEDAVRKVMAA